MADPAAGAAPARMPDVQSRPPIILPVALAPSIRPVPSGSRGRSSGGLKTHTPGAPDRLQIPAHDVGSAALLRRHPRRLPAECGATSIGWLRSSVCPVYPEMSDAQKHEVVDAVAAFLAATPS
ncbi:MAG: hypothetical protein R3F31_19085 [Verrucomicrobiales bacterium]